MSFDCTPNTTKQICKFFAKRQCNRGRFCEYLHIIDSKSLEEYHQDAAVNSNSISQRSAGPTASNYFHQAKVHGNGNASALACRHFFTKGWCGFGENCRFSHIISPTASDYISTNHTEVDLSPETQADFQRELHDKKQVVESTVINRSEIPIASELQKPCRFFQSGHCRLGKRCTFAHVTRSTGAHGTGVKSRNVATRVRGKKEVRTTNVRKDDYELKTVLTADSAYHHDGNCERSKIRASDKNGPAKHEDVGERFQPGANQFGRDVTLKEHSLVQAVRLVQDDPKLARSQEIEQLRKRFPESVELELNDGSATFQFTFSPSDPDWPYDVKAINMQVTFPEQYPIEMMSVLVCDDGQMPDTVRRLVTESIENWIKMRHKVVTSGVLDLTFRPMLRWFDRTAENIFTDALRQYKREKMAEAAGIQFIPASQLRKVYTGSVDKKEPAGKTAIDLKENGNPDSDSVETIVEDKTIPVSTAITADTSSESAIENSISDPPPQSIPLNPNPQSLDTPRRGTEVTLQSLSLGEGMASIHVNNITLIVACSRCSRTTELKTPSGRTNSLDCSTCRSGMLVRFNACIAHRFSSVIGYCDLEGCAVVDLVLADSRFVVACLGCDKEMTMESLAPGQPNCSWCPHCHQKLTVSANSVRFLKIVSAAAQLDVAHACTVEVKRPVRSVKDPLVQEGRPLPANGTCRHYKKSFRWLRFPCCGKAYPCDVCHDERENHEMKFANRMICGYCAKEQPYSSEGACTGCAASMTNRTTAHWEGGTGCRDKIKMSRNDDKKYANASKTISRSAQEKKDSGKKTTKLRHAV